MRTIRTRGKKQEPRYCPHCGEELPRGGAKNPPAASSSDERSSNLPGLPELNDEHLKAIAKQVVPEVMNVIKPLVDKLHLAMQQQQQEILSQGGAVISEGEDYAKKMHDMQAAALERMKRQENKVAERMSRIQKRLGNFGAGQQGGG